ncbi:MAG: MBL fold metallo-hydrolase [Cryobacterium sp.]|nr:MBL fold metallo-hydrolase [Cryobacterium sp.]
MQVTSQSQFEAAERDAVPPLERITDGLYSLGVEFPGVKPHATLCYLLQVGNDIHIIDPGWDSDQNWQRLVSSLETIGGRPNQIRSVTVTHLHPDHLGMAQRVRDETNALVAVHLAEQRALEELSAPQPKQLVLERFKNWGVPDSKVQDLLSAFERRSNWRGIDADLLLEDGENLPIKSLGISALHLPGHTTGHLGLVDAKRGYLFTGDHLLPNQFSGIGLGGQSHSDPIEDYFQSLDRMLEFDEFEALPGHGYRFKGISERTNQVRSHHLERAREVSNQLGETSVWKIAEKLSWTDGWQNLSGLALLSALSQTELHVDRLRSLT